MEIGNKYAKLTGDKILSSFLEESISVKKGLVKKKILQLNNSLCRRAIVANALK